MSMKRRPTHPGEILKEEFLVPLGITQTELAKALNTSFRTINEIINARREISVEMALKLSRFLGTTAELWLNLQTQYNLFAVMEEKSRIFTNIKPFVAPRVTVAH